MTQETGKWIGDNQIKGRHVRLDNAEMLRARNAAGTGDINVLRLNTTDTPEFQIIPVAASGLPIPNLPKQFATIEFITNVIAGKGDPKNAVNALADSNIPLTGVAPLTIDAVPFSQTTPPMSIGLTGQTDGTQNGAYDYNVSGGNYTLTRRADFDQLNDASGTEVTSGAYFRVISGTVYAGYEAVLTTADPITLGTTSLTFARYPSALVLTAGDGLKRVGNDFSIDLAPLGGLTSTNPGNPAGQMKVLTDQAPLEKDQSSRVDPTSGAVSAKRSKRERFTLAAGDITNGYVDLANVAEQDSIEFQPVGAPTQFETIDYTVNYTGGSGSKTRVTWTGGLATGGISALVVGDIVDVRYRAF